MGGNGDDKIAHKGEEIRGLKQRAEERKRRKMKNFLTSFGTDEN